MVPFMCTWGLYFWDVFILTSFPALLQRQCHFEEWVDVLGLGRRTSVHKINFSDFIFC